MSVPTLLLTPLLFANAGSPETMAPIAVASASSVSTILGQASGELFSTKPKPPALSFYADCKCTYSAEPPVTYYGDCKVKARRWSVQGNVGKLDERYTHFLVNMGQGGTYQEKWLVMQGDMPPTLPTGARTLVRISTEEQQITSVEGRSVEGRYGSWRVDLTNQQLELLNNAIGNAQSVTIGFEKDGEIIGRFEAVSTGYLSAIRESQDFMKRYSAGRQGITCTKQDCFITTAVTRGLGLCDDNPLLTGFRKFRDETLMSTELGSELVRAYYAIAPTISNNLQHESSPDALYEHVLARYLIPALFAIQSGDDKRAIDVYQQLVLRLAQRYGLRVDSGLVRLNELQTPASAFR